VKKIILLLCFFVLGSLSVNALNLPDRSVISDWYIKDFQAEITVNSDRSLNIVEKIIADAGSLPNKHGIFRNVPKSVERNGRVISLPLTLKSITDFKGNPHKYDSSLDFMNNVQVWKIGDPDKTVKGENEYKIDYLMKNAVYTLDEGFDELYWNVLGAFWTLEIDNFKARIVLPEGLNKSNIEVGVFSGPVGVSDNVLNAKIEFLNSNILEISAINIKNNNGITVSLKFPKGFFEIEKESIFLRNILMLLFIIPILVFIICFKIWKKDGKDFKDNKAIMPIFLPVKELSVLEMGAILNNGKLKNEFLSAEIINLAVKGFLTIEKKTLFWIFGKTYLFSATNKEKKDLLKIEKAVLDAIFSGKKQVSLDQIRISFFEKYKRIKDDVLSDLDKKGLFNKLSIKYQVTFFVFFVFTLFSFIMSLIFFITVNEAFSYSLFFVVLTLFFLWIIFLVFSIIMPQRTEKGVELYRNIKGFRMYMETAEKYRQQFNEKENIFERFLPYAIMFGMTKLWIKKFQKIYGVKEFNRYAPHWIIGSSMSFNNFSSLNNMISSISKDIGGNLGSSSSNSSGGGGTSGGGGGGGGGGGW